MSVRAFVVDEADCELEGWDDPVRGVVTWKTLLSADRRPSEAITLGVAELCEADAPELKLHRHAQPEAYYVLAGNGLMHIDGVDYPLSPGVAAFIPGGALHGARSVGAKSLRILYVFAADSFDQIHYEFPVATDAPVR